jgi:NAD/NADP transhydrogenase beta subunit
MRKHALAPAWVLFVIYVVLLGAIAVVGPRMAGAQDGIVDTLSWYLLDLFSFVLAVSVLVRNGLPNARRIITALVMGALVGLAYSYESDISALPLIIEGAVLTVVGAAAVFSFIDKRPELGFKMLVGHSPRAVVTSVGIGLGIGAVMAVLNTLAFIVVGEPINPDGDVPYALAMAIKPAFCEELCNRAVFFVFCLYLLRGLPKSRAQAFTCWFMMIVPHMLPHTVAVLAFEGPGMWLAYVLFLTICAGLPLALLQRKRDITSAMVAHGLVDFVRCALGQW